MGNKVYWQPKNPEANKVGGSKLAEIITAKFGGDCTITDSELYWLDGLADAGVDGARDLMAAIGDIGPITITVSG